MRVSKQALESKVGQYKEAGVLRQKAGTIWQTSAETTAYE